MYTGLCVRCSLVTSSMSWDCQMRCRPASVGPLRGLGATITGEGGVDTLSAILPVIRAYRRYRLQSYSYRLTHLHPGNIPMRTDGKMVGGCCCLGEQSCSSPPLSSYVRARRVKCQESSRNADPTNSSVFTASSPESRSSLLPAIFCANPQYSAALKIVQTACTLRLALGPVGIGRVVRKGCRTLWLVSATGTLLFTR